MSQQQSFGIVPLKYIQGKCFVFLVQQHQGHWGFPKGHPEEGESPQETAERELLEETGLTIVRMLPLDSFSENYSFLFQGKRIFKKVTYFVALVEGDYVLQTAEILRGRWLVLEEALHIVTFPSLSQFLKQLLLDFFRNCSSGKSCI